MAELKEFLVFQHLDPFSRNQANPAHYWVGLLFPEPCVPHSNMVANGSITKSPMFSQKVPDSPELELGSLTPPHLEVWVSGSLSVYSHSY